MTPAPLSFKTRGGGEAGGRGGGSHTRTGPGRTPPPWAGLRVHTGPKGQKAPFDQGGVGGHSAVGPQVLLRGRGAGWGGSVADLLKGAPCGTVVVIVGGVGRGVRG